jgi:DNA repair metallo-beta-lactamase
MEETAGAPSACGSPVDAKTGCIERTASDAVMLSNDAAQNGNGAADTTLFPEPRERCEGISMATTAGDEAIDREGYANMEHSSSTSDNNTNDKDVNADDEDVDEFDDDYDEDTIDEEIPLMDLLLKRKMQRLSSSQDASQGNSQITNLDVVKVHGETAAMTGAGCLVNNTSASAQLGSTVAWLGSREYGNASTGNEQAANEVTQSEKSVVEVLDLTKDNDDDDDDGPLVVFAENDDPIGGSEDKTCFICGLYVEALKSRLAHIKRCSKKYGISLRDLDCKDDILVDEGYGDGEGAAKRSPMPSPSAGSVMTVSSTPDGTSGSVTPINPYMRRLTPQSTVATTSSTPVSSGVTSMAKSVDSVLMAGAKRAAQLAKAGLDAGKVDGADGLQAKLAAEAVKMRYNANYNSNKYSNKKRTRTYGQYNASVCPSYKMIATTDFCVDGFHYANVVKTRNFFLTHFHADHYGGITGEWNQGTIYCSVVTASLVQTQLGVQYHYLHPLPLLKPTIVMSDSQAIEVTLIDANHCPGAVLFLFRIGEKYVLHVGDFRWNRAIMQAQGPLQPFFHKERELETIYLDTTYCDEKYNLPTQQEAIAATIRAVDEQLRRVPFPRLLLVFGAYTIGKERIYMAVAEHLDCKVYVENRRYDILSQLQWSPEQMKRLTKNAGETCLWVVPLSHVTMKRLPSYLTIKKKKFEGKFDRVVGFRPTGWTHSPQKRSSNIVSTVQKDNVVSCGVPYSEHSSFPELVDSLYCLQPRKIIPTVKASKSKQQVDLLLNALQRKKMPT